MDKEKFDFTKAYHDIEEINEWFQQEDIDLEKGLEKYRKGLELIKKCKQRLEKTENQLREIQKEFPKEEPGAGESF